MRGLVPDLPADALLATLSGGQRQRVLLARTLVRPGDVLFLDEPTNHLDLDGVAWLADHVRGRWPAGSGALVVVTHDRWFLDEVAGAMWEVHDGVVEQYDGGYAAYILQRVERARVASATERRRQNLLRKELAWLRRGAPARTSKPKFRIDAANELIADVPPVRRPGRPRSPRRGAAGQGGGLAPRLLGHVRNGRGARTRSFGTSRGASDPASGRESSARTARASPRCSASSRGQSSPRAGR